MKVLTLNAQHNGAIVNIKAGAIRAVEESGSGALVYFDGGAVKVKQNRAEVFADWQAAHEAEAAEDHTKATKAIREAVDGIEAELGLPPVSQITDPTLAPMYVPALTNR